MKPRYQISFSGGRTSAYMTKMLLDHFGDKNEFIVTFANTGMEHPKTLEFVHNCDLHFGFNTVWLESVVRPGRVSSGHRVVTFETASRNGEPYEQSITKYGIPNKAFPQCTMELKVNPMRSYLRSIGVSHIEIPTAIGIRADEKRRVSKEAGAKHITYPLIDIWPTDKQDVLDWWEGQAFDLGIDEFEGNCLGCYKKSLRKHFMQMERDPACYEFYARMERQYRTVGPQQGERVFFRGNMDTEALRAAFRDYTADGGSNHHPRMDPDANGGCSESCEVYETEAT